LWQVLHVILYMPLFSDIKFCVVGLTSCCRVAVALNAIYIVVFLYDLWQVLHVILYMPLFFVIRFQILCCGPYELL